MSNNMDFHKDIRRIKPGGNWNQRQQDHWVAGLCWAPTFQSTAAMKFPPRRGDSMLAGAEGRDQ